MHSHLVLSCSNRWSCSVYGHRNCTVQTKLDVEYGGVIQ